MTLSAGPHELTLVNEELGFRDVRSVDVKSGKGVAIQPEVPKAAVSLNALPWAEVVIDATGVPDAVPVAGGARRATLFVEAGLPSPKRVR